MIQTRMDIDDIAVVIEGSGETLLMIHGWPDTYRLWDNTVAALSAQYQCVRFTLPGFDINRAPRPSTLAELVETIRRVADAVSPDQPLTLVLHDWGCIFGYEFAARHPARVARIVAVDIGDYNSSACIRALSTTAKLQVFSYQFWLALSWKIGSAGGERLANWMVRTMAGRMRCPTAASGIHWQMNYPYAMKWFGFKGGLNHAARIGPACPILYTFGERKPFMFQSPEWVEKISSRAGSEVEAFATGHWVMIEQAELFNRRVAQWLSMSRAAART